MTQVMNFKTIQNIRILYDVEQAAKSIVNICREKGISDASLSPLEASVETRNSCFRNTRGRPNTGHLLKIR